MGTIRVAPVIILSWLLAAVSADCQITWPGEKAFQGYTTLDQLAPAFAKDTTTYGRKYLIQALGPFVEKNGITAPAPDWLVQQIAKATMSHDPYLVYEAIVAAQELKIYSLSDTLVKVYQASRRRHGGVMQLIHTSIAGCLMKFNNPSSRHALANIAATPLPPKIACDIIPALKALSQVGDSTTATTLSTLSSRVQFTRDSLTTSRVGADTGSAKSMGVVVAAVERTRQMILARGGAR
jgi:hypothetical protein